MTHAWSSKDNLLGSVISFNPVGSGASRHGGKEACWDSLSATVVVLRTV